MEKRDCGFGQWQLFAISYDEYKRQVAANVAMLDLELEDGRRVYREVIDMNLNPGDAEIVAGNMGLI